MSALAVAAGPDDRELDDLDLVAAVRAGDDRAFEALFLRYQPRIAAYVGGMVRDHGRAEDITQEVFMAALRRLRTGDEREILFRPWIYEIAKNKCIDAYRRGRNTTEVSFDADDQIGAADQGRLAAPGATPDAAVEGKVAFDNLRGAFGGLSPVHHEILVMREFEGLSYREIGDRLGMSRPAVESTLFRARKRLGEEYEELVSGKRCLRVQAIVDDSSERAAGLRDQRRVARHLAHCQPCRRYAHLAGADLDLLRRPSVAARVAAFLPLPAFLRRRLGGSEEATQMLGQQAARPAVQWSAHLAGSLDPGAVSTWAKAAATAATVALAGVGGSAIEHHGTASAAPAAKAAAAGAGAAVLAPRRRARPCAGGRSGRRGHGPGRRGAGIGRRRVPGRWGAGRGRTVGDGRRGSAIGREHCRRSAWSAPRWRGFAADGRWLGGHHAGARDRRRRRDGARAPAPGRRGRRRFRGRKLETRRRDEADRALPRRRARGGCGRAEGGRRPGPGRRQAQGARQGQGRRHAGRRRRSDRGARRPRRARRTGT